MVALFRLLDLSPPAALRELIPIRVPTAKAGQRGWPWQHLPTSLDRPIPVQLPDALCLSLDTGSEAPPTFSRSAAMDWECSALLPGSGDSDRSSLFLQVRGAADYRFNVIRVKFNLADGAMTTRLARNALGFVNAAMALPPSDDLDEELVRKLINRENFYFHAGYYALTFRREINDTDRYNLIGFNRRSAGTMPISDWPRIRRNGDRRVTLVPKGPRLTSPSR